MRNGILLLQTVTTTTCWHILIHTLRQTHVHIVKWACIVQFAKLTAASLFLPIPFFFSHAVTHNVTYLSTRSHMCVCVLVSECVLHLSWCCLRKQSPLPQLCSRWPRPPCANSSSYVSSLSSLHSLSILLLYPADSLSRTLFGIAQFAQNRSACSHCLEKIPPKCNSEFQWLWKLTPPPARRPPTPHKVCRCLNELNVYIHSLYLICGIYV